MGFSTGSLALGDFRQALGRLRRKPVTAVELSALRTNELAPLVAAVGSLDLAQYRYISVHAPSRFGASEEVAIVEQLGEFVSRGWPVVLHPDTIHQFDLWTKFGELLYIENMDKRKPIGRTVPELARIFQRLPQASLCFDIAHARQVDSSMTEAYRILKSFGSRVRQVHVSEVTVGSRHDRISYGAMRAFQEVAGMIPTWVPVILETPVSTEAAMLEELSTAISALTSAPASLAV